MHRSEEIRLKLSSLAAAAKEQGVLSHVAHTSTGQTTASIDIDVDRNVLTKQGNYMGIASPLASAVDAFANAASGAAQAGGSLTAQVESM